MSSVKLNETSQQKVEYKLSSFLASCKAIGIDDFETMISIIEEHVLNGIDNNESATELKKRLMFLNECNKLVRDLSIIGTWE